MKKLLQIAGKDLLVNAKDKFTYLYMLATPIILITILGLALGSGVDEVTVDLPVVVQGSGAVSNQFLEALESIDSIKVEKTGNAEDAKQKVKDGDRVAAVVIPEGFSDAVISGKEADVEVYYENETDARVTLIKEVVSGICEEFSNRGKPAAEPLVKTKMKKISRTFSNNSFNQYVGGYAITFMLFGVMIGILSILEEKEKGTFARLQTMPVSRTALLGGKELGNFCLIVMQAVVLFAFGYIAFRIDVTNSIPGVALIILAVSFASCGLGLIAAGFIKKSTQAPGILVPLILGMSALGGCWWPLWIEPPWLQAVAKATVTGWGMEGLNNILVYNKGFNSVLVPCLALLIYGLICFAIGIKVFKFTDA
ncbi:MAG: ABC transporter permease [Actinobacteria bacterium]|nr:ABC transporter permease [Actinomycetota bacterium]